MTGYRQPDGWLWWFLCGFGTGWLPLAPGTWAAALALMLAATLHAVTSEFFPIALAIAITAAGVIGLIGIPRAEVLWGKDPTPVVLDEMLGMWVAIWAAPVEWKIWSAIFLAFRVFDIAKPLGIRYLERLPGGWGVMLDDVLAGIYAFLLWRAFDWLWP